MKELLDEIVDTSVYVMKLLAFRPSRIVQLDMGGQGLLLRVGRILC